jgi:peptidyl-prolyl cis-trans isomerase B (cyclophilin B)
MKGIIGICVASWLLLAPVGLAGGQAGTGQAGTGQRGRGAAPAPAPAAPAAAQRSPGAGPIIVFETAAKGTFEMETYPNEAPKTVAHILALVKRNFYNGQRVHRMVPGFVVQWGDPLSRDYTRRERWGTGGSGTAIGVSEVNPKRTHRLGAVAAAHPGDPRLADSQIYVTLAPTPRLDRDFTVFAQVISGMDVVRKLEVGDVIRRATVKDGAPATK